MATNNRGGTRTRNGANTRAATGRNTNPEGRNQYSGLKGTVRSNPVATAAAVGGAVAAGVFLWSRRNEISDRIADLSEQISDWRANSTDEPSSSAGLAGGRTQAEIAEEALTLKEVGQPA